MTVENMLPASWHTVSHDADTTARFGRVVGRHCLDGDVVALVGELVAGKTHFVRGMAAGMGIDPGDVSSPTFVLIQEYSGKAATHDLVHMDAYRLECADDLASIGWQWGGEEMRRDVVTAVEWADRLAVSPDGAVLQVHLEHVDETARRVTVVPGGTWCSRTSRLVADLEATSTPSGPDRS